MKRVILVVLSAALGLGLGAAPQAQKVVTVRGHGRHAEYREAVNDALNEALGQVQGVSLQTAKDVLIDSFKGYSTEEGKVEKVHQQLKQSLVAKTDGRIKSFEIVSKSYDEALKQWVIDVEAQVPGPYVIGRDPNNLRRMIVMPFRAAGTGATVYGKKTITGPCCEEIAAKLNDCLTQTRRFTMLNREFDAAVQAELSRLNLEGSAAGDMSRFKQLLVTDYMVIGMVKLFDSPTAASNPYTGRVQVSDGPFMEISYRVILVPTSQLKWANTIMIPYSMAGGGNVEVMISAALGAAADRICNEIVSNIYPMRVTAKTTFELVLNQGGTNVRPGETLEVFRATEQVTDVTTGESLGASEEMIARATVTRVTPKMSYAQVVEGTALAEIPVGSIVRRAVPVFAPAAAGADANGAATVNKDGSIVPPWKEKK